MDDPGSRAPVKARPTLLPYMLMWLAMFGVAAVIAVAATARAEDRLLVFAGATLAITGLAHSYLGERFILQRLFRRSDLPRLVGSREFMKQTLRLAWHLTTIGWLGAAMLVLSYAGAPPSPRAVLHGIALTSAASALVSFAVARGKHLSWLAFALVALATWAGTN